MVTSQKGINLIKAFEGLSLKAVRLQGEQYYTIGYGHYGADVSAGQTMTQAQAEALLRTDLKKFEAWVTQYAPWTMNQNEFDALVSFCYNCGPRNLQKLVKGRTKKQVASHMMTYTHSGSEAYTQGLINRRKKEQELFLTPVEDEEDEMERWHKLEDIPAGYLRQEAQKLIKRGVIAGTGSDLDLTKDMLRTMIMTERSTEKKLEDMESTINWIHSYLHDLEAK